MPRTKRELEADVLALTVALAEAIETHPDEDVVAELDEVLKVHKKRGKDIFRAIQAEVINDLEFPVMLRKMWSGGEVQEWLKEQANQKR